jgi:hypothetical protein
VAAVRAAMAAWVTHGSPVVHPCHRRTLGALAPPADSLCPRATFPARCAVGRLEIVPGEATLDGTGGESARAT